MSWGVWPVALAFGVNAIVDTPVWPGVVVGGGIVAAFAWRRFDDVAVLTDLDRRLGLHELLSTAATLRGNDEAAQVVRDQAEQVARTIDVRSVLHDPRPLRSLTTSAVALAASIALSFTFARPAESTATASVDAATSLPAGEGQGADSAARAEPDSPRAFGEAGQPEPQVSSGTGSQRSATGSRDAAGVSAATSEARRVSTPPAKDRATVADGETTARGTSTKARAVGGTPSPHDAVAGRGDLAVSTEAVGGQPLLGASPSAVDVARVPAVSRDLVRAFFTPDDEGRP